MRIYYNKLNKEVKKNIKEKRYSRTELKKVYDDLKKSARAQEQNIQKGYGHGDRNYCRIKSDDDSGKSATAASPVYLIRNACLWCRRAYCLLGIDVWDPENTV